MSDARFSGAVGAAATSLEEALRARRSSREYDAARKLPEALLLRLLWAGFGVNRPENGRRTAPSGMDRREVAIYVALPAGLFLYDAEAPGLRKCLDRDLRALTGRQAFAAEAPADLVFVADMERAAGENAEKRILMVGLDVGFISQNVSLFCAAEGLATVPRTSVDAEALREAMGLRRGGRVVMAQSVGYPRG